MEARCEEPYIIVAHSLFNVLKEVTAKRLPIRMLQKLLLCRPLIMKNVLPASKSMIRFTFLDAEQTKIKLRRTCVMSLLEDRIVYKPFLYPWAYDSWLTQQRIHWLPEEVPLAEDVKDWHKTLTVSEKKLADTDFPVFRTG